VTERLCIRNILTADPVGGEATHKTFFIADGVIAAVVEGDATPELGVGVIEGKDRLLMPGLVNAHMHSPLNVLKGTGDVLNHVAFMWRNQADTVGRTPDEVRLSALMGSIEHLLNGTTTVVDHFPEQGFAAQDVDAVVDAYSTAGMRALVALRIFDEPYTDIEPPSGLPAGDVDNPLTPPPLDETLALVASSIEHHDHAAGGLIRVCPAPSNPMRCSDKLLTGVRDMADQYDTPIHMHLLETAIQARIARGRYGTSMVRHMDDLGFVSPRLSTAHSIWLDDDEIAIMAARGAVPVHNPDSNLKLGAGIAPIAKMLRAGIPVALGTDGASTNDNLDLHEVMRIAIMLQRPGTPDRAHWPTAQDALRMATVNGGKVLGIDRLGSLAPGAPADLVLHDLTAPFWAPLNDPVLQLVFGASGSTVDTVIVNGRIVVEGRRILSFDAAAVMAEAGDLVRHLRARNAGVGAWVRQIEKATRDAPP